MVKRERVRARGAGSLTTIRRPAPRADRRGRGGSPSDRRSSGDDTAFAVIGVFEDFGGVVEPGVAQPPRQGAASLTPWAYPMPGPQRFAAFEAVD
jgi:hypothetical protein